MVRPVQQTLEKLISPDLSKVKANTPKTNNFKRKVPSILGVLGWGLNLSISDFFFFNQKANPQNLRLLVGVQDTDKIPSTKVPCSHIPWRKLNKQCSYEKLLLVICKLTREADRNAQGQDLNPLHPLTRNFHVLHLFLAGHGVVDYHQHHERMWKSFRKP